MPIADSAPKPLVTLFVMAYRQEALVREAIEGAFAQTWSPLEIILSDDASPDGTFQVMQEMAAAYDGPHRVILNRNPVNLGIVRHIDRIMEFARGDFVVQNAGDDVSAPRRTEALVGIWTASGRRIKLVHSAAAVIDATGARIGDRRPDPLMISAPTPLNIVRHRLVALGAASAWDREVFDAFGPLGGDLGVEDTLIPFRAALLGEIGYSDEELIGWRAGGASWNPRLGTARERLYGIVPRLARWRAQNFEHILNCFPGVDYPDRMQVEAICRESAARLGLVADLAEASRAGRLALAPRVLGQALRWRTIQPLRLWLQYLFDEPYMRWSDARHGAGTRPATPENPTRGATP